MAHDLQPSRSIPRLGLWLFAAAAALALGAFGFQQYDGEHASWANSLYLSLQLFVLHSVHLEPPIPIALHLARFAAPIVLSAAAVAALFSILRERAPLWRLPFLEGHVVICGLGRKAMQLARDCREHGDRVVVLVGDPTNEFVAPCRQAGAMVVFADGTDPLVLARVRAHRALFLVALYADDGANVECALQACELVHRRCPGSARKPQLLVHVVNVQLRAVLRLHKSFPMDVRIFNAYEISARALFDEHPLDYEWIEASDPRVVHLMVLGFGRMGEAVLLQAARIAHFANRQKLRVTVIDHDADRRERDLLSRFPQLSVICDVRFIQREIGDPEVLDWLVDWSDEAETLSTIVSCFDDDALNVSVVLNLLPRFEDLRGPLLVRMKSAEGLTKLLELQERVPESTYAGHVHAFGTIDRSCPRSSIFEERSAELAKINHRAYVEDQRRRGKHPTPGLEPWERLRDDFRESNRQQVDHIWIKLRALGCRRSSPGQPALGPPLHEIDKPAEIELLAEMEHARWCAERFLAGWRYGKPTNRERRISESLVSWSQLAEEVKENDRGHVRNIPGLLRTAGEEVTR